MLSSSAWFKGCAKIRGMLAMVLSSFRRPLCIQFSRQLSYLTNRDNLQTQYDAVIIGAGNIFWAKIKQNGPFSFIQPSSFTWEPPPPFFSVQEDHLQYHTVKAICLLTPVKCRFSVERVPNMQNFGCFSFRSQWTGFCEYSLCKPSENVGLCGIWL